WAFSPASRAWRCWPGNGGTKFQRRSISSGSGTSIRRCMTTPEERSPGMDRMTEHGTAGGVRRFYDSLAPDYDLMTSFDARFAKERPRFKEIVETYGIGRELDAGCGP